MGLRSLASFPVYPFLVAALPVIYFYEAHFRTLNGGDGTRLLILYGVVTALLLALGRVLWKDIHRSALVVAPLAVVLFLGGKTGDTAALVFLAAALGLGILLKWRPFDARPASSILNVTCLVLAALPIIQTVRDHWAKESPEPTALFRESLDLPRGSGPLPDIYYLVLDGLGQPEFLEHEFGLSPQVVEGVLRERGFEVMRRAKANYPQTALSLASTLNVGLVQDLLTIPDPECTDRRALAHLVSENRVVRALSDLGYDLVTFPSGYPLARMAGAARRHHPVIDPNFLEYYTLEDGALPLVQRLLGHGPADLSFGLRRNRLEYVFDHLARARVGIPAGRPVFVFAHIMAPHPPFVFRRTGEGRRSLSTFSFADGSHWYDHHGHNDRSYVELYGEQLTYVMERLGEAVDAILESSLRPPVILVQGDHGPGSRLHHERFTDTDLRERLGIFNAWYLPPGFDLDLAEGQSALNTFPALFNALFGAGLPYQPDRHFFARMSSPYAYREWDPKAD